MLKEIPEGYRELKEDDIILGDDLAFNSNNKWTMEKHLGNASAIGQNYVTNMHFLTVRKIDSFYEKIIKDAKKEWTFFKLRGNPPIIASNSTGGYLFLENGNSYYGDSFQHGYSTNCNKQNKFKQLKNVREALNYITSDARGKVYEFLNIKREKIEVSDAQKEELVNYLRKNNAFNADSAMKLSEKKTDICYELVDLNILKNVKDRFYYKE